VPFSACRNRTPLPAQATEYVPRKPHDTVLYGIVREHLATLLEHTARTDAALLPRYVVDTFEDYLLCSDHSPGFVRCHCDACGHDLLVALSCKRRGLCPSCGVRRMYNEAAHIVDEDVRTAR
jgi:Transposase zinc-binding domain